ncbi:MAG: hypothetical protein JW956_11190 [Calditrichaceae bacterium]|nr:hypothetical protein [Calditrichaceae bacterium]
MKVKTLLPAGKSLHGMLATHYTKLKSLIHDLEESRFSGYLKLEFWEYEGYLIFDTGIVVQGYERDHEVLNSGVKALLNIEKKFQEKDGSISTYTVDSEFVPFLFGKFENTIVTELANINQEDLIAFIDDARESLEMGFIDIVFGQNRMWASIYLMNSKVAAVATKNSEGKERFEKGKSLLYDKVIKMAGTIENKVSLKKCGALKSYEDSQNFHQIFDLIDLSDFAMLVIKRLMSFMEAAPSDISPQTYISELWKLCCNETGIKTVEFENSQFIGLENTTLTDFGYLISKVLEKLKPVFDDMTKKYSFMDQIIYSYKKNKEFLSNPGLLTNIHYFKGLKIK